jgi:predicted secreted protein
MRKLTTAAATLVFCAGFVTSAGAAGSSTAPVYTLKDSGKTVHLAKHHTFKIRLKTAADSGYEWKFTHRPDPTIVKVVRKRVRSTPGQIGGYAHTVITLKTVGAGTTREKLVEKRPFGTGKLIGTFSLTEVVGH